jgi:predicted MFS family arabinose efflux permease
MYIRKTRLALLGTSLLNEPLTLLYSWLPFVLRKDLGASSFQVALLMTLRPVMSIVAFYWSMYIEKQRGRLRSNLAIAGILARIPFFFVFFTDNVWFLILISALHMLFLRGGIPAWMEILNLNLPKDKREKFFSWSSALGYAEGVFLALQIGALLDSDFHIWKLLYLLSALLGLCGVYMQWRLPIRGEDERGEPPESKKEVNGFLRPWKKSWTLIRSRPDFAHFQYGFMIGGFGIMMVATALPLFFVDVLHLSHMTFATARSICMGLGFVLSSHLWTKALQLLPVARLTCAICLGFALFPLLLIFASYHMIWLYIAYVVYGATQGGSHIIWHLSGPLFAKDEDSSQLSGVNVMTVGVRGLIAPFISNLLCCYFGPDRTLLVGMAVCLTGALYMAIRKSHSEIEFFRN